MSNIVSNIADRRAKAKLAYRAARFALLPSEQIALAWLTLHEQSALLFWQQALRTRSIAIPANMVYRLEHAFPPTAGHYVLWVEPKALSPKAIREGRAYAKAAEVMEQKNARRKGLTLARDAINPNPNPNPR